MPLHTSLRCTGFTGSGRLPRTRSVLHFSFFHYFSIKFREFWKLLESSQEDRNYHDYYPYSTGLLMLMEQYFPGKEFQTVSHW